MRTLESLCVGALVLVLLAGCVQIPEEQKQSEVPQTEEAPPVLSENVTETVQPPVSNVTQPLAPLPVENKTNTSSRATTTTNVTQSSNSTTQKTGVSGWTTEPLQIEEGETLRVVLKKTV